MTASALMFMGTGSDVGKSLIVAGLCRAYRRRGLKVAPFKPQNMSNNAAVTEDGGEIGRAQALQARASGLAPHTRMNPLLLKPEQETGAQVILQGQRVASMSARQYFQTRQRFLPDVLSGFDELANTADLVLVEGAGSASEVNLRHNDLANFGFARAAGVPVALIGDIQRGGVIAALLGTLSVVDPDDAACIVALIVNKFQGDLTLFEQGMDFIAARADLPCFGPVPLFLDAEKLPAEDALGLDARPKYTRLRSEEVSFKIAVPRLARIANFDDFDPLRAEPDVCVTFIQPGSPIPRDTDLIILPGSKATIADLAFLREQGWDIDIAAHVRNGGVVLGICGGYQMLGKVLADPQAIEGPSGSVNGLGLLDVETILAGRKQLRVENAREAVSGAPLGGYHMHLGVTNGPDCARPFAFVGKKKQGAVSPDGRVMGTYLHGVFASDDFRRAFLKRLGLRSASNLNYETQIEGVLDGLAAHLEQYLDLDALLALAKPVRLAE